MPESIVTPPDDDMDRDQQLETVIADYIRSCESGTVPDRREILARHPKLAGELREFFGQHDRINRMAQPIRGFGDDLSQALGPGQELSYVGNYELLEEIARGGMGVIYKARQTTLGRIVAVKMIVAGRLATEEDVQRFLVEAKAVAGLQHPNIVAIHEVGQHEGWHYFSMDYVEGRDLAKIVRENVLPAKQAAGYVRQMAEAIHYAHQQGTLHRDLKPSNILIDEHDQVRITDFGLAMRVEGDSDLTRTGQILGTPSYMPPEQAQGKRSLIGPGSDVYSLGAVLYECLTGRAPFRADSVMKTIDQVIHVEAASPRLLNSGIPRDLETICLKCLQKEPHRRYGTAQLLADDLGRFLRGEPIMARSVGTIERAWRWCRRNPVVAGLVVTAVACLIVGTSVSSYFAVEANNRARSEAFYRVRADDKAADAVREKAIAEIAREEAKTSAILAENRREESDASATLARRYLYVAHMNLAQSAWKDGRVDVVYDLLQRHVPKPSAEDLRGFEWYYWNRLCRRDLLIHPYWIVSLAISPDGKRIASVDFHGMGTLWDATTGERIREIKGFQGHDNTVKFSPDGKWFAAGGDNSTIIIWDSMTGEKVRTITGPADWVTSIAFSPDGMQIVSGSRDGRVRVWETITGEERLELKYSRFPIDINSMTGVAFSPDGTRIASWTDKTITLWDVAQAKAPLTLTGHTRTVNSVAFSPDGTRMVSASEDGSLRIWELSANKSDAMPVVLRDYNAVTCVAFSPDGTRIASGSSFDRVTIWNAATGKVVHRLDGHVGSVNSVAFTPDGTRIASGDDDGRLLLRDMALRDESRTLIVKTKWVRHLEFSHDGAQIIAGTEVVDAMTGRETFTTDGHGRNGSGTTSGDRTVIPMLNSDGTVTLQHTATGHPTCKLKGHSGKLSGFVLSADGKQIAAASTDNSIQLFDSSTGAKVRTLALQSGNVRQFAFSPDGSRVVSLKRDNNAPSEAVIIQLWDVSNGQELLTTIDQSVADFTPDGTRLATASCHGTVKIWDTVTGQETLNLETHTDTFDSLAFSPDGTRLATGDNYGSVKIWDAPRALHEEVVRPLPVSSWRTAE